MIATLFRLFWRIECAWSFGGSRQDVEERKMTLGPQGPVVGLAVFSGERSSASLSQHTVIFGFRGRPGDVLPVLLLSLQSIAVSPKALFAIQPPLQYITKLPRDSKRSVDLRQTLTASIFNRSTHFRHISDPQCSETETSRLVAGFNRRHRRLHG